MSTIYDMLKRRYVRREEKEKELREFKRKLLNEIYDFCKELPNFVLLGNTLKYSRNGCEYKEVLQLNIFKGFVIVLKPWGKSSEITRLDKNEFPLQKLVKIIEEFMLDEEVNL